jgi:hypothetical protein
MIRPRATLLRLPVLVIGTWISVSAQTVISTHSGVLYFFEGSVLLGGEPLEQKFGKFPDIGEGRELRTELGRAEVLLTPGVFLRIGDHSTIRMVSERLADTRVELLGGSAIIEVTQAAPDTASTLIYKQWQVRVPNEGVYRIDSDPSQVHVYRGQAEISTEGQTEKVIVKGRELLPLAAVLVPDPSPAPGGDAFNTWAMNRSQAVSADNAVAAQIVDDPNQMDSSGLSLGGFSYFPQMGVPSLGIINPYGVSFWSPYQSTFNSIYFPSYVYGTLYPVRPGGFVFNPRPPLFPPRIGPGQRSGVAPPRVPVTSPRPIPRLTTPPRVMIRH